MQAEHELAARHGMYVHPDRIHSPLPFAKEKKSVFEFLFAFNFRGSNVILIRTIDWSSSTDRMSVFVRFSFPCSRRRQGFARVAVSEQARRPRSQFRTITQAAVRPDRAAAHGLSQSFSVLLCRQSRASYACD
jgi:hypothetical protein